jgi:hypothetical protein
MDEPAKKDETNPTGGVTPDIFKGEIAPKEADPSAPTDIVKDLHQAAVLAVAKNDKGVQEKIIEQAKSTVDQNLGAIDQTNQANLQKATYDANAEACQSYGISQSVPVWQIKLKKAAPGEYALLVPKPELKETWIAHLKHRADHTGLPKDAKALECCSKWYDDDMKEYAQEEKDGVRVVWLDDFITKDLILSICE